MPQRGLAALTQEPTLLAPGTRKPTRSWSSLAPAADVPAAARGTTVRPSRDVVRTDCHLASDTPEIILLGGPAVSGHPCRGAGRPDRGHQDPPRADRLLRLPVLRGAAARRRRRVACQLLHSPLTRLGTADAHGVSSPVGACLDWQRHAAGTAQPQTPPGRRHQDGPDPSAACPPPALAPAGLRMRRRWAAVPGRPRRPAQRKPLRPDLAPGPRRSHAGGRDRCPAGPPPLRPPPCRAVAVAGLRRPARRDRCPRRA